MVSWGSRLGLPGALAIHPSVATEELEGSPLPLIVGTACRFKRKEKELNERPLALSRFPVPPHLSHSCYLGRAEGGWQ